MRTWTRRHTWLVLSFAGLLLLAACGSAVSELADADPANPEPLPAATATESPAKTGASVHYLGGVELWPDVLEGIRGAKPAIGAFLCEAVPHEFADGALHLRVPNGSGFHRDQLGDRGNLAIMEREAASVYGGRVRLTFEFVAASEAPAREEQTAERPGAGEPARGDRQSESAGDGDVLERVLEMFDGEVDESP